MGSELYKAVLEDERVLTVDSWRTDNPSAAGKRHRVQINLLCSACEEYHGVGLYGVRKYLVWYETLSAEDRVGFERKLESSVQSKQSVLPAMRIYKARGGK